VAPVQGVSAKLSLGDLVEAHYGIDERELWWPASPTPTPIPLLLPPPLPLFLPLPLPLPLTRWPATVNRVWADGSIGVLYDDGDVEPKKPLSRLRPRGVAVVAAVTAAAAAAAGGGGEGGGGEGGGGEGGGGGGGEGGGGEGGDGGGGDGGGGEGGGANEGGGGEGGGGEGGGLGGGGLGEGAAAAAAGGAATAAAAAAVAAADGTAADGMVVDGTAVVKKWMCAICYKDDTPIKERQALSCMCTFCLSPCLRRHLDAERKWARKRSPQCPLCKTAIMQAVQHEVNAVKPSPYQPPPPPPTAATAPARTTRMLLRHNSGLLLCSDVHDEIRNSTSYVRGRACPNGDCFPLSVMASCGLISRSHALRPTRDTTERYVRVLREASVKFLASTSRVRVEQRRRVAGAAAAHMNDTYEHIVHMVCMSYLRQQEALPEDSDLAAALLEPFKEPGHWTPPSRGHFASWMGAVAMVLGKQIIVFERRGSHYVTPVTVYGAHTEFGGALELTKGRSAVPPTVPAFMLRSFEQVLQIMIHKPGTCAVVELGPDHFDPWIQSVCGVAERVHRFHSAGSFEAWCNMGPSISSHGFEVHPFANEMPMSFANEAAVAHLPGTLAQPMIYLSRAQATALHHLPSTAAALEFTALPAWVQQQRIGFDLGMMSGVNGPARHRRALLEHTGGRHHVWATEFENVHDTFDYDEPELQIDGRWYVDSEAYYQAQKPIPFDEAVWARARDAVMMRALRAKLAVRPELGTLLLATGDHPLLSIKNDRYWGFDADLGGRNRLAELWTELRTEVRADAMLKRCVGVRVCA
jgi:predicted NAD-dependent protein-ADP-ribosyltransferase YbiA (DUF1768 family)